MSRDLPPGAWNLPPGVRPRDIDPPDRQCPECGKLFTPREGQEICGRCEAREDEEDRCAK